MKRLNPSQMAAESRSVCQAVDYLLNMLDEEQRGKVAMSVVVHDARLLLSYVKRQPQVVRDCIARSGT